MVLDFLDGYAWVVWIALILLFVIIEVSTLEFTFLMIATGSVGGLVADLLGAPWWVQFLVAAVLAVLLLFVVRPALLKVVKRGADPTPSNVAALIGLAGVVTIDFSGSANHVKLANGETWTARGPHIPPLVEGQRVVVTAIEGATAVVALAERTEP